MASNRCDSCRFYKGADNECRRRSPQLYGQHGNTRFPTVYRSQWCGEFVPKIEEPIKKDVYR